MNKVWVIFERSSPMDRIKTLCSTEDAANRKCDELDVKYPNSHGFYYEEWDVED